MNMKKMLKHRGGCLNCPQTEDFLSMDEVLYNGFGGYRVEKDGELYYQGKSDQAFEDFKTLREIEDMAKLNHPNAYWEVILDNPLRGATWTRDNETRKWILTDINQGFA